MPTFFDVLVSKDIYYPLIKTIDNCHLTIIGEGPLRKNLEAQIKSLDISEKVKFTGYIKNYNSSNTSNLPLLD